MEAQVTWEWECLGHLLTVHEQAATVLQSSAHSFYFGQYNPECLVNLFYMVSIAYVMFSVFI